MKTAEQLIQQIQNEAQDTGNSAVFVRTLQVGEHGRQGDLYLWFLGTEKPEDAKSPLPERQLAPGNTKGSRHVAEAPSKVLKSRHDDPLVGPRIWSDKRFEVSHPEHSNVSLPSGLYEVTYQRDLRQEERARVMD